MPDTLDKSARLDAPMMDPFFDKERLREQQRLTNQRLAEIYQREERRKVFWRVIRWVVGIPMILSYPWLGFMSVFLLAIGCVMVAPDAVRGLITLAANLMTPERRGKQTPNYGIPETLAARGQYLEAETKYEEIIEEFPNEIKPHIGLINIAVVRLNNAEVAEKIYRRGLEQLKDPQGRKLLTELYEAILSRLKTEQTKTRIAFSREDIQSRLPGHQSPSTGSGHGERLPGVRPPEHPG